MKQSARGLIPVLAGTLVFDQPSVKDAAAHIHSLLVKTTSVPPPSAPLMLPAAPSKPSGAAIRVQVVSRLPTDVAHPETYRDPFHTVPFARWDLQAPDRTGRLVNRARFGAWLEQVDEFDATLFGISAPEAELMDPQQRLVLESAWQAVQVHPSMPMWCPCLLNEVLLRPPT